MTHLPRSRFLIPIAAAFLLAVCVSCRAAWPTIQSYPKVNSATVIANNSTTYAVSVMISDPDGYTDIAEIRLLFGFNESGGDMTKGRGYMAWGLSDSNITHYGGTWTLAASGGGGRWGYTTDVWGGTTYITPVLCSMSYSGNATGGIGTRTVTWLFKAKPAWAMNPLINDADIWAADASSNIIGWRESPNDFDVVASSCTSTAATPQPPIVADSTASSLDVSIDPGDSDTDLYCIGVAPSVPTTQFVQSDGTLGGYSVFQTKADWGTKTITGLMSDTAYTFTLRAIGSTPGSCPSQYSAPTTVSTAVLTHVIDYAAPGAVIHKGIMGMDAQPKRISAQRQADTLAASYNTSMRGGGDGYDWKTRTAQWNSGTQSTLQRLREARDRNSYLQILTNTRGIGTGNGPTWVYTDQTPETLAALTADWVFYCNKLLQTKRQGDPLDTREQAVLDSMQWGTDDKLLAPGEAAVPKVEYWEIGNEPEGPYPPPALTPADYANRYKIISQAVLAADPTVKVGPCMMTADNGNAWLDAVLSDPANQVDFINYHPYGPLYGITKTTSGGVLNADDLNAGLNILKQQQADKKQKVVERLQANGRPLDTPLVASEFNPSSWQGTYYFNLCRTVAHGLGMAENVFAYAQLGLLAAQYWDLPNNGGSATIEVPGFKVLKALQQYMGDRLLDTYDENDFRLYTTLDTKTGELIVWALNFSEHRDKNVRFRIPSVSRGVSITRQTLAAVNGPTSLLTMNNAGDAYENVDWSVTKLSVDPGDFTLNFPRATLTMLRFERPMNTLPDGTDVTLSGKSVTAVYPSESYLYIEQDDRTWGIRVTGDCAEISVGDKVTIAGTIETRKPDGSTAAERYIVGESIVDSSSGANVFPIGMTCRSVGGGANDQNAGVKDGVGLNNIGLLVKIAGKVTAVVDGERMYVDDGSMISDIDGRTGVLVRCPDTTSFSVGDVVVVTGVIEGDVPNGWTTNRRYIRARDVLNRG